MRLFLYEYACAQPASVLLPVSVRREGQAMFEAVLEDARKLAPRLEVITLPTQDYYSQADYALIIAPEFDGILERLAREALAAGCRLLGPLPEAIRLTADKWELYQFWKRRGVPTPVTWLHDQLPVVPGKYVTKHRYGAGSLGVAWWNPAEPLSINHLVHCHNNQMGLKDGYQPAALARDALQLRDVPLLAQRAGINRIPVHLSDNTLVQAYVEGIPVSIALLISLDGTITPLLPALQIMNERFEYLGGAFLDNEQFCERVVRLATTAVEEIPGLQGYVGVDAILGQSAEGVGDMVLEINPRLTTSYLGLRRATENNLLKCMLEAQSCDKVVPINWFPEGIKWTS